MIKVLFICHGNICRSPMAEYTFKHMVKQLNIEDDFIIDSAATSTEELGNSVYPPAKRKMEEEGINCSGHRARQMRMEDYRNNDYILVMDDMNMRNLRYIIGNDVDDKVYKLLDFTDRPGAIADPWYTRDFDTCYDSILRGLNGFLKHLGYLL